MYRIELDSVGIVVVYVSGFFELESARALNRDVLKAVDQMRKSRNRTLVACVSEGELHAASPEAMAEFIAFQKILLRGPQDKMANVVASALVRMQFERLGQPDQVKSFETLDQAKEWLLG